MYLLGLALQMDKGRMKDRTKISATQNIPLAAITSETVHFDENRIYRRGVLKASQLLLYFFGKYLHATDCPAWHKRQTQTLRESSGAVVHKS